MSSFRRGTWTNWAGNQSATPSAVHLPRDQEEVSTIVRRAAEARRTVKAIGSGHSFTSTAVTDGEMIRLDHLRRLVAVDRAASTVTVEAGITIADLNELLHGLGLAMPNLGDIAYQTISGAIATGTHGTGRALTGIAAQVVAMRVVAGDGSVMDLSPERHPTLFHAARVGVGALGLVTEVTLRVVPAFRLRAKEGAQPLSALLESLDEHVEANDHFEFFWIPHTKWALTKRNNRTDDPVEIPSRFKHWYAKTFMENYAFGAVCRVGRARPSLIPRLATALPSTGQSTIVDESHRIFASQRLVRFVEMEYAVPRAACADVLREITAMIDNRGHLVSFPVEVRFTAADDVPLSTASGRESAYIAVHMYKGMPFEPYFRDVEAVMRGHEGRPHWGKMHFLGAEELSGLYPQWEAFQQARQRIDPMRTFANAYTARVFGV